MQIQQPILSRAGYPSNRTSAEPRFANYIEKDEPRFRKGVGACSWVIVENGEGLQ